MNTSLQMSEQRNLLKEEITELIETTLPAKILQVVNSFIQRLTRRSNPIPWYVSTTVLGIIAALPQALLALILKEPDQFIGNGLIWSISVWIVVPIISLCYLSAKFILTIIRDHIIDRIKEKDDLNDLRSFLIQSVNQRKAFFYALTVSFIWSITATLAFSFLNHNFIGLGLSIDVWMWGFCALGIGLYFLLWYMQFPSRLKNYHYDLYELNPSRSEVLVHISTIFTRPFFIIALYLAIGTIACSMFKVFFWVIFVVIFLFWIPLLMQFINSQTAINKIVLTKKWQTLNNLQEQIHKLNSNKSVNTPENIEAINKLMDLHERVYSARNVKQTISRIFDFVNQLLIPLFAFLISNYDSVLKLFKLKP